MQPARFRTLPIPAFGQNVNPVPVCRAAPESMGGVPLRVVVRNAGAAAGAGIVLAFEIQELQPAPGGSSYNNIPIGTADVFVVMPGQTLLAIGLLATQAAVAESPAFPIGAPPSER